VYRLGVRIATIEECRRGGCGDNMKNETQAHRLELGHGEARYMGDGVYVVLQRDEFGDAQSVVLTTGDLRRLRGAARSSSAWVRQVVAALAQVFQSRTRLAVRPL